MKQFILLILFLSGAVFVSGQDYERNIMLEVFTNSHCPLCPAAHSTIDSYVNNSPNAARVKYIYYHMSYPYPDDELYKYNMADANGKNQFYGPFSSTPRAFFDGEIQSNSYNQWSSRIENRLAVQSPVQILLTGGASGNDVTINADINMNSSLSGELLMNLIVVEDVTYSGRNGINNHKNVMRQIVTSPSGDAISVSANQKFTKTFSISNELNKNSTSFIVFVQDKSTLEVYQSAEISYTELGTTDIADESVNHEFKLEQNYPNPFNPTTSIQYQVASNEKVSLKVYDVLGKEISTLVSEFKPAGTYEVEFDGSDLPSGVYFYTLSAGEYISTKKLILLK